MKSRGTQKRVSPVGLFPMQLVTSEIGGNRLGTSVRPQKKSGSGSHSESIIIGINHCIQSHVDVEKRDQSGHLGCYRYVLALFIWSFFWLAAGEPELISLSGTVGQRFIQLLATHPYFRLHALGASSRSAGQTYAAATKWKLATPIPKEVAGMVVLECDPAVKEFSECGVVFSGLDDRVGDGG